jgi:hypothetical protein
MARRLLSCEILTEGVHPCAQAACSAISIGHLRFDGRLSAWESFFCFSLFLLQYRTQHHRNVNAMPLQHYQGGKTPLELFIAGVRGWEGQLRKQVRNESPFLE